MPPRVITTARLTLRPLRTEDLERPEVVRWHLAPEGYRHMHEEPYADPDAFRTVGAAWVRGWEAGGPSYWLALDRATGDAVGLGGVRRLEFEGQEYLNLYYRLDPATRGRGLGREIATAAVVYARDWCPGLPVVARIATANGPSRRTARASGMSEVGPWRSAADVADLPAPILFTSPVVLTGRPEGETAYDSLLDLWGAVNAAGGAVGFVGSAPRAAVAAALDRHLAQVEAGESELVRIAEPTLQTWDDPLSHGRLLGFGFAHRYSGPAAHRAHLERVMVHPDQQRRALGRVLLADLHADARARGVELVTIGYRGGTGLGRFYAAAGYLETGRLAGGLRLADASGSRDVDDVQMAHRLDGTPINR